MQPSRDQVVHDLAMACVYGVIQAKVTEECKESYPVVTANDLAIDAAMAYKDAYETIDFHMQITDE